VSGVTVRSPYMYRNLAAKLISWSAASVAKSANMISTTGRSPASAMPLAMPVIAASAIGVDTTCWGNLVDKPLLTLKAPP
jgi:hypothetical protein